MENKSDEHFLFIQAITEANRQETDEKLTNLTEDLKVMITSTITSIMYQNNNYKSSPFQNDASNPLDPTTVVPANRRAPSLKVGNKTKIGGMWTLKHKINSPKFMNYSSI